MSNTDEADMKTAEETAPTIIRTSFCAEGVLGGTKLFLYDEGGKFLIATRFQNIGRRKRIEHALALFEQTLTEGAFQ